VIPMAGVSFGGIGSGLLPLLGELEGAGSLDESVEGTSVWMLADSEGFVEEAAVEEGRSDSARDDASLEGVGVGVDLGSGVGVTEDCRAALSRVVETGTSSAALSSCRRKAAWGAAPAD
jgi:hypothetical protein